MKHTIIIAGLLLVFIVACKKSSTPASTSSTNNTNSSGYYGVLSEFQFQTLSAGTISAPFNEYNAQFSSTPMNSSATATLAVNSVSLNGTFFKWSNMQYGDTTFSIVCPPGTWAVNGANGIPSFTYTNNNPIPAFTGYTSWPDTIYRSHNTTIPMTGVSGADLITVNIMDGITGASQGMAVTGNSVTFSTSSMSGLNATNYGTLMVLLDKSNVQSLSGKSMNFLNAYELTKTVVIK